MYRASLRSSANFARTVRQPAVSRCAQRFASTAAGRSSGTWKGAATRWGLAAGALYWYNTSPIFADEAAHNGSPASTVASSTATSFSPDESEFRTIDTLLEEKQRAAVEKKTAASKDTKKADTTASAAPQATTSPTPAGEKGSEGRAAPNDGSPEALEEEAGQQGAFNPETGEINWDCPCLGGMASGPCGEDFKAAFSCFVYSTEEPKGMDCIEKFQHMQDCFRQYPEIYAAELSDDEQENESAEPGDQKQQTLASEALSPSEARPTDSSPAVSDKAVSENVASEKSAAPQQSADSAKSDTIAATSKPAPAPSTSEAPSNLFVDDVVQADSSLPPTPPPDAPEAISANHVPTAAFDATSANKN
ncbi:Oxidoreductase [Sporothrix epigloea]|uniref:Mitochondrial intermembrane space import and assembly protein 40 n=1 Tax=Sporothrix epigloea TaxID=1892477 RepID=A0ABP0DBT5_9PEZI